MLLEEILPVNEAFHAHFNRSIVESNLVASSELRGKAWTIDNEQIVILASECWVIANVNSFTGYKLNGLVLDKCTDQHALQVNEDRA